MSAADPWSERTTLQLRGALRENSPAAGGVEPHLRAAIEDAASRPGKLLRGRLALATTGAHGVAESTGLALATAVEYFHLASLLLDDLPCMDDGELRRGQPCAHRVHGEANAILAALAFINRAYALAGLAMAAQPCEVRARMVACLDGCLGAIGLLGGQARDLAFVAGERSARDVGSIALGKTGALFWLGLLFPALLTRPMERERRALEAVCVYWSLAFQALDDLQDVLATSAAAGKTTGRDRALARPNLAVALGVPATRRRIERLTRQAHGRIAAMAAIRPAWRYLESFQRYFVEAAEPVLAGCGAVAA